MRARVRACVRACARARACGCGCARARARACVCVCVCVICDLYKCVLVAVDELCKALKAPERLGVVQILI